MKHPIVRNLIVIVATWIASFLAVQAAQASSGGWIVTDSAALVVYVAAVAVAVSWGARPSAYLIAIVAAFQTSELVAHSIWSIRSVQSGPVHLTVMMAAALGLILGAWIRRAPPHEAAHGREVSLQIG